MVQSFNFLDFRSVADYLMGCDDFGKREAVIRTAIGRVYYTAYLKIRDKARLVGFRERNNSGQGGVHDQLISFLQTLDPKHSGLSNQNSLQLQIAQALKGLKTLRTNSDYEKEEINGKHFSIADGIFKALELRTSGSYWQLS